MQNMCIIDKSNANLGARNFPFEFHIIVIIAMYFSWAIVFVKFAQLIKSVVFNPQIDTRLVSLLAICPTYKFIDVNATHFIKR